MLTSDKEETNTADLGLGDGKGTGGSQTGSNNNSENQGGGKPPKTSAKKQAINLHRFLQIKPQESGITALLLSKYRGDAKTVEDWEATLKSLLETKAK
jgi:hypothetical protein